MANYTIASCDTGNGNTNAIISVNEREKSICIASVRARISQQTLGLGKGAEVDYAWAEWGGTRYAVGDDVLVANRSTIEHHMGATRYGNEMHRFLTAYALARLGVKTGEVDLTLMCPPALYNDTKQVMIDAYSAHPVEITLKGDKKPRQWKYSKVTVWPEGFPAISCFMLDAEGKLAVNELAAGDVLILDVGAHTANAFIATNGKFNPANLIKSTIENGGGDTHIRTPLLEWVRALGGELTAVSIDDIDRVLRLASASEDYTLRFGKASVDLLPPLQSLAGQYGSWLANNVIDSTFNQLRGINGLLVVGGNADYVIPSLTEWYGEKVIQRTQWRNLGRLHPADLNAAGGLRLALARLSAKK